MPTNNKHRSRKLLHNYIKRMPAFMQITLALVLAGLACNLTIPDALNWYVATDGSDRNPCLTPEEPCLTIYEALDRATDDDIIHVGSGTFRERPLLVGGHITLEGDGREATVIDFDGGTEGLRVLGPYRVLVTDLAITNVANSEGTINSCLYIQRPAIRVRLENVKITNCAGAGVYVNNPSSSERIELSIVDSLIGENDKRGIDVFRTDLEIIRSTIYQNNWQAIHTYNSALELVDSDVEHNQVTAIQLWGGSILVTGSRIQNNGEALRTIVEAFGTPYRAVNAGIYLGESDEPSSGVIQDSVIARNIDGIGTGSDATLTIERTRIEGNLRTGVKLWSGNLTMSDVDVIGNGREELAWFDETGGVTVRRGTAQISNSTIRENLGGILVHDGATLLLDHSTISGNAGLNDGGITNQGELEILKSTISDNGLLITDGRLVAAGIMNFAKLVIENSTISGNRGVGLLNATYDLRDLSRAPSMTLNYVTIANNQTAGLSFRQIIDPSSLRVNNSLIVKNPGGDCIYDSALSIVWGGTNIDTDESCGLGLTITPAELLLGGLADNGGPTKTHALLPGSPAIDVALGSCPATDQRSAPRPVGLGCDVGAYETGAVPLSGEDPDIVIDTPTPDRPSTVTITTTTPCYNGPGPEYGQHSSLQTGVVSHLIGAGFTGNGNQDWVVASHPTAANTNCWLDTNDVVPSIPFSQMRLITVPGLPTPTPKPTSDRPSPEDTPIPCYYNQNNALICP